MPNAARKTFPVLKRQLNWKTLTTRKRFKLQNWRAFRPSISYSKVHARHQELPTQLLIVTSSNGCLKLLSQLLTQLSRPPMNQTLEPTHDPTFEPTDEQLLSQSMSQESNNWTKKQMCQKYFKRMKSFCTQVGQKKFFKKKRKSQWKSTFSAASRISKNLR